MPKIKAARGGKKTGKGLTTWRGAIPCLVVLALGALLLMTLIYFSFQGGQ
jgi:hypothetical protein